MSAVSQLHEMKTGTNDSKYYIIPNFIKKVKEMCVCYAKICKEKASDDVR